MTPLRHPNWPVNSIARKGEHKGWFDYIRSQARPSEANLSRNGVCFTSFPFAATELYRCWSEKTNTIFGFFSWLILIPPKHHLIGPRAERIKLYWSRDQECGNMKGEMSIPVEEKRPVKQLSQKPPESKSTKKALGIILTPKQKYWVRLKLAQFVEFCQNGFHFNCIIWWGIFDVREGHFARTIDNKNSAISDADLF